MKAKKLSPWQRITSALKLPFGGQLELSFDANLAAELKELAEAEGRNEGELAAEMLNSAINLRQASYQAIENWKGLTDREQEITALYCLGYTTQQIAERLVLSANTVKSHITRILHKFGLRERLTLLRLLGKWNFSDWPH